MVPTKAKIKQTPTHLTMSINSYFILDAVEVRQLQTGIVFTGKIKFKELNQVFKLTERRENYLDPFDDTILNYPSTKEFQRQLSEKKLKEIQRFLSDELKESQAGKSLGMFPSSLILYNRSYESDDLQLPESDVEINESTGLTENIIASSYHSKLDCCFFLPNGNTYKLYLPKNPDITLIVDGQHRFCGTRNFYTSITDDESKRKIEEFEFIMTFLVGFDLFEVGQIFATVNFNQKPVNRSLYYDIFGSAPQTDREGNLQNDIRLAHDLALHLNNNPNSPIYSMIKLLGKGYGLFSQAFFVQNMIRVFKTGVWDNFLIDFITGGKDYRTIAKFMSDYLEAIKEAYPSSWAVPLRTESGKDIYSSYSYPYILCKTTGLGAFFRLIRDIYPRVENRNKEFKSGILEILQRFPDSEAQRLFAKTGKYGGAGSEGIQDKLYKELKSILQLDLG